jgi:hypothetical protein
MSKETTIITTAIAAALALLGVVVEESVVSIPNASARANPVKIGNQNDFRLGPPIPSCNADLHQGPPDYPIKGCRDSPAP